MSLHNFLLIVEPATFPRLVPPARERGTAVATKIIRLVETWHKGAASGDRPG